MDYKKEIQSLVEEIKAQGYEAICFWLPAYNTGGGTYYFCEIAKYLVRNTNLHIYYMDYPDGYPSQLLRRTNVTILTYRLEDNSFPVQEKCVIITNSTRAIQLTNMRPDNKLLFWHYETAPCAWDIVFILGEKQRYLNLTQQKHAMLFHDWSSWDILSQDCGTAYEKQYLPLYLKQREVRPHEAPVDINEINVAWIGRLAKEKNQSLFNVIDNFAKYHTSRKKIFHIIGDGPLSCDVRKYIEKYKDIIDFILTGTIPVNKLSQYLSDHVDVLFAMGLSVLEGASIGIPSVVVKLDIKPISGDEFFWLSDSMDYCVGILPSQRDRFTVCFRSFATIINSVLAPGGKAAYGKRCYDYYLCNHSNEEFAIYQLLSAIKSDEMNMQELKDCIKYIPYTHVKLKKKILLGRIISKRVFFENSEEERK